LSRSALDGLRVIEFSHAMAGEMAGMVLADNGADVIKIERPGPSGRRMTSGYRVWNRGKRRREVDLSLAAARPELDALVAQADAVVADLSASTADRLGVSYERLRVVNPSLVYVCISGFGERGPLRNVPGYEYLVSAKSGRMADQPTISGSRPAFTPTPIASYGAAMLAVQGLLAAVHHRDRGAPGQRVHTSLLHALVTVDMTSGHGHRIHTPDTSGKVYGVMPLAFMTARCRDGEFLQMCSRFPHLFRNWMRVLGLEHLYDDPAYSQMPDILPSQQALDELVQEARSKMAERTREEWLAIFSAEDVGANPFLSPQAFLECEQAAAAGSVADVEDPDFGRLRQVGPIAVLSDTPASVGRGAPPVASTPEPAGSAPNWLASQSARSKGGSGSAPRYPLDDITIVEAAFAYAAPQAATLLAEMGARVIKVEPPGGDPARRNWRTTYAKETPGKESVILDLKSTEGRQLLHELVAKADVFLHNFRPGVPQRLGADYETLSAINPRLVYAYGSCYGSTGPWSHLPGFHSSPNAIAGTGVLEAGSGNPPQNRTFGDPAGALGLAAGILMALHARRETGRGQYVEGTMLGSLAHAVSHYSVHHAGASLTVPGQAAMVMPPVVAQDQRGLGPWCRLYETADGWLLLCCAKDAEKAALRRVLEQRGSRLPGGQESARQEADGAQDDDEQLLAAFCAAFARADTDTWEKVLLDAGAPAVRADDPVLFDFMLRSEHMRANGLAIEDDIEGAGRIWRSSGSAEFSAAPLRIASPVSLGHDTESVLAELGRSPEEIATLRAAGVIKIVGQGLAD
jgi:crotonobetainyl-CoA:carnitine CoA-transferase CaiB-like acyl-CoA transferase